MSVILQEWKKRSPPPLPEDHGSDNDDENERFGAEVENGRENLFACPNEGCIKMYQRYGSMINHTLYGQCVFSVRERVPYGYSEGLYCKTLLGENNAFMVTTVTAAKSSLSSPQNVLDEGWASRSTNLPNLTVRNRGVSSRKSSESVRRQGENLTP